MSVYTLDFIVPDSIWLQSNGTQPYRLVRADMVRQLKWLGLSAARAAGIPRLGKSRIIATITPRTHGRFDPNNAHPTTKALVDGITEAGVWPDDNSEWVLGPDHRRGVGVAPKDVRLVHFKIIPATEE